MLQRYALVRNFFSQLEVLDAQIAALVAEGGCRHCGGGLHRSDYQRKPRGALVASAGEAFKKRYSLCCGKRGCRKRALPPSLRFLGRRVYLEVVVILASVVAQVLATAREAAAATGVSARTLLRWRRWWRGEFPKLPTWLVLRANLVPPPPDESQLPRSLLAHLGWEPEVEPGGASEDTSTRLCEKLRQVARSLASMTTSSVVDGSRFVRDLCTEIAAG